MRIAVLLLLVMAALGGWTVLAAAPAATAQTDDEGLMPVKVKGLDHVSARPGANLSEYNKVMLDPVDVSFSKNWNRDPNGGPITPAERKTIKDGLAKIVRDELGKELARSGRYTLVNTPDNNVLRIRAEIRDLYINAPDSPRAAVSRTYALSVGEMRLVAELRDAPTGALIARAVDFKRDPDAPWLHLTSQVDNVAAARRAASDWARILREQLDAAHGLKP